MLCSKWLVVLIPFLLVLTSSSCSSKEIVFPEVLFYKLSDSYLGDLSSTIINSKGEIREFEGILKPHILNELLEQPESHEKGVLIGNIDLVELHQYYAYVLKINKKSEILYTQNPTEGIVGQKEWYGVRYVKGTVESIIITGGKELSITNTDKNAEIIVPWITEVLQ
ncbi:hypothetical protein [Bacillus alkalicellulosilyticus]|uniref:hypothetical protein n=1 Tax=Alkalihalobacterium alkalicellulosilyticum TaxID=1912214 RepID=UPI0009972F3F|nr:hypothetical protein [Bacillus alkalicellulosilyticus]